MSRPSQLLERLENWLLNKLGRRLSKLKPYLPLLLLAWYFYGMLINSVLLGIANTFSPFGKTPANIWVVSPAKNLLAPFTVGGLGISGICLLLFCLITKKGYTWFSGYKYIRDPRGFDILPEATHGSSSFMTRKEMGKVLNLNKLEQLNGTIIGKHKEYPDDDTPHYAELKPESRLDNHAIIFGATGSGKSRGYVRPFIFQAVKRRESIIVVDPKAELYESTAEYMRKEAGYTVKVFNLLDPEHSDGWNPLNDIEFDRNLVDAIAEVIIKNTSNVSERQDFWEKAEKNLLIALMHYVQSQTVPGTKQLLPIEQRALGSIYRLLSNKSFADLEQMIDGLPKGHPAKAPYGIFKLAHRQIWGNIAIGLGNRLSMYQNPLLDRITAYNDIDLTLPGREPCIYYCVISAENTQYEFLSSLFFSCIISRLIDHARREGKGGRLPVAVNLLLEEFCNIGTLGADFLKQLAILRGFNIHCQLLVQSIPQLSSRYPKDQWEEIISHCDCMVCLGANDLKTATYFSQKSGRITIRVNNNQMPLTPLFSPINSSTRPYSQTRSNTQRDLMMPDEVLRMDNGQCLVLLRGQKPLLLHKITPEEFPLFGSLKHTRIVDYLPIWQQQNTVIAELEAVPLSIQETRQEDNIIPQAANMPSKQSINTKPGWYSQVEYTVTDDESTQNTENKYGGLQVMELTPAAVIEQTRNTQN